MSHVTKGSETPQENPALLNARIEALFKKWNDAVDVTPEASLQQTFFLRLEESNWLGDAMYHWPELEDKRQHATQDRMSRTDILASIADIFATCYFKPLGIKAPIKIITSLTRKKNPRTRMFYDPQNGEIVIMVDKETYGVPAKDRYFQSYGNTLRDRWNSDPIYVITGLIEELSHKFDHEVTKKYLRGEFKPNSPWCDYARSLLPQFFNTPGHYLYNSGTYYLCNPIERRAETVMENAFGVLAKVFEKAEDHEMAIQDIAEKAECHRPYPNLKYTKVLYTRHERK